ncbi:MAG: hypothetical protein ACTSVB_03140 [Candidatus Heimdallarchaeaceae archaeon]
MDLEDKYNELQVSPFNIPFLRDLGIKVVAIVNFDILFGPVCFLKELSSSSFGKKLKKVDTLAELYTGFARTDIDVITTLDEKVIVSSYTEKLETSEVTSLLFLVCVPSADTEKLVQYCRSLTKRIKGEPEKFNSALSFIIEQERKKSHSLIIERNGTRIKGLNINDASIVSGNEFFNFNGFLFIDYNRAEVDGRFFPKRVNEKKVDFRALVKFIDTQKNEAELSFGELITLYYKGLELLIYLHNTGAIMVGTKKLRSRINYNFINKWFFNFFDVYLGVHGVPEEKGTLETLKYLDREISGEPKRFIISELIDLMINSEKSTPELLVTPSSIRKRGWISLRTKYELFLEYLGLFNGELSIYKISQEMSVTLSKVVEFIIFLKSRNLLEVYKKKR